jgi:hypothetical protein
MPLASGKIPKLKVAEEMVKPTKVATKEIPMEIKVARITAEEEMVMVPPFHLQVEA